MQKYMYYKFLPHFIPHNTYHHHAPKTTKSTSAAKQIREAGATVNACAHLILGDQTAKRYFGNRNFSTIKLQGVVKSSTVVRQRRTTGRSGRSILTSLFPIQAAHPMR